MRVLKTLSRRLPFQISKRTCYNAKTLQHRKGFYDMPIHFTILYSAFLTAALGGYVGKFIFI
jgi:hypothetical protein